MYEQQITVDLNRKKPPEGMTDSFWRDYFSQMRKLVTKSRFRYMPYPYSNESYGGYHGDTIYQTYCKFINSILRTIRSGERDYCFFIYQIAELLKYEPRLQSKWLPEEECFQVWMNGRR